MKQLEPTKTDEWISEHKVGDTITGRVAEVREGRAQVEVGEGVNAICRFSTENKGQSGSSNTQKADITSAAALLAAKFKQGVGAPETGPRLRVGETRQFAVSSIDPEKKRIELELAN